MRHSNVTLALLFALPTTLFTSGTAIAQNTLGANLNTITTAVPFLLITPDSRGGAMGDAGAATSPDANSIYWNPAKLAFAEDELGISVSHTPWLRKLVSDISLSQVSFYRRIDKASTIGASFRFFSLGQINTMSPTSGITTTIRPIEFATDIAYARILSKRLSGGIALKYIYSNLLRGTSLAGVSSKPAKTLAGDLSTYYQNEDFCMLKKNAVYAFGINISNIGSKISYGSSRSDFIPINLRIGQRITMNMNENHSISLTTDFNKLLTPTPPYYKKDSSGVAVLDPDSNYILLSGRDPNRSVFNGMLTSFVDAPGVVVVDQNGDLVEVEKGSVLREEMREITYAIGLEYRFDEYVAVRAGYFGEHSTKGNRKFFTLGAGLKYKAFGLDVAYLIPVNFDPSVTQRSPLENTLRFTIYFDIG